MHSFEAEPGRRRPGLGNGYGPWPLGLHYGRFLAKDGRMKSVRPFRQASSRRSLGPRPSAPQTWRRRLRLTSFAAA